MVATTTADVSASPGAVATLRLNMLPVVFPDEIQKDVVYSLPYSDELWEGTKERARGGKTFHSYRHGGRIYLWPHSLAAQAIELGLVDELRMFRYPVVVGGGTPFLPPVADDIALELIEARTFGSRVIYERYRRARAESE
jgi:hypothetical protein